MLISFIRKSRQIMYEPAMATESSIEDQTMPEQILITDIQTIQMNLFVLMNANSTDKSR